MVADAFCEPTEDVNSMPTAVVGRHEGGAHPAPARDDGAPAQRAELRAATRSWLASSDR